MFDLSANSKYVQVDEMFLTMVRNFFFAVFSGRKKGMKTETVRH
jgi:hypothetical protein